MTKLKPHELPKPKTDNLMEVVRSQDGMMFSRPNSEKLLYENVSKEILDGWVSRNPFLQEIRKAQMTKPTFEEYVKRKLYKTSKIT